MKRRGLAGAEPVTRRRGRKLPATAPAARPATAPGPGKAGTVPLEEKGLSWFNLVKCTWRGGTAIDSPLSFTSSSLMLNFGHHCVPAPAPGPTKPTTRKLAARPSATRHRCHLGPGPAAAAGCRRRLLLQQAPSVSESGSGPGRPGTGRRATRRQSWPAQYCLVRVNRDLRRHRHGSPRRRTDSNNSARAVLVRRGGRAARAASRTRTP